MEILLKFDYPGNVRELENILEHALIISQEQEILPEHLPDYIQQTMAVADGPAQTIDELLKRSIPGERERIIQTLNHRITSYNVCYTKLLRAILFVVGIIALPPQTMSLQLSNIIPFHLPPQGGAIRNNFV